MKLNLKEINELDMSFLSDWSAGGDSKENLTAEAGKEHYRLLTYISLQYNNIKIADVGTRYGSSAYALGHNKNNIVKTFDIVDEKVNFNKDNITFYKHNLIEDITPILDCYIVMLDIDPHDGKTEDEFIRLLVTNDYQGILMMDDIDWYSFPDLKNLWNSIKLTKYNITKYGHFSGTGIINFSDEEIVLE